MAPTVLLEPPEKLTSDEGHYATVRKVEKGRFEGKWQLQIERPGQTPKKFHTSPSFGAVRTKMAKFLNLPLSSITVHIGNPRHQTTSRQETPSTPSATKSGANKMSIPTCLKTDYGHTGTITPSGHHWDLDIQGPMAPFGGSSSTMTTSVSSNPTEESAKELVATILAIPPDNIHFSYETIMQPSSTPNKPCDKFEFSPNSRATCHACHKRIAKNTQRVGIQEYNFRYQHWQPIYYHEECCDDSMLDSLDFASSGSKRKRQDASDNNNNVSTKLEQELMRQQEQESSKRRLVYGQRQELREELRRLRREFATQLEVEPYKVFDDATLDDIVAKLPSSEKQLIQQCRGIAQKRCDRYGAAILQVISQYRQEENEDQVPCEDGMSSENDNDL